MGSAMEPPALNLTTDKDYFSTQHSSTWLSNAIKLCSLWGGNILQVSLHKRPMFSFILIPLSAQWQVGKAWELPRQHSFTYRGATGRTVGSGSRDWHATCFTVRESNPGWGEIFRTRPDRPLGPTQPPTKWVPDIFSGNKAAGAWL
jgi:hypothetical protein